MLRSLDIYCMINLISPEIMFNTGNDIRQDLSTAIPVSLLTIHLMRHRVAPRYLAVLH